jgi:hypothetical protein
LILAIFQEHPSDSPHYSRPQQWTQNWCSSASESLGREMAPTRSTSPIESLGSQEDFFAQPLQPIAQQKLREQATTTPPSHRQRASKGSQPAKLRRRLPSSAPPTKSSSSGHASSTPSRSKRGGQATKQNASKIQALAVKATQNKERHSSQYSSSGTQSEISSNKTAEDNREAKDRFLVEKRTEGLSYRDIKRLGGFPEAESTLRGRWRTLTKTKEERVRRPEWTELDVSQLFTFGGGSLTRDFGRKLC